VISSLNFPIRSFSWNFLACLIAFLKAFASELPCAFTHIPFTPKNGAPPY